MRVLKRFEKRFEDFPWDKVAIALAVAAIAAWSVGWIAGAIVTFIARR